MVNDDTHEYGDISRAKIDLMLNELHSRGAAISGNNPWSIETHQHGVELSAVWDEAASMLAIRVSDKNWYVPWETVWRTIDSLIERVQGLEIA